MVPFNMSEKVVDLAHQILRVLRMPGQESRSQPQKHTRPPYSSSSRTKERRDKFHKSDISQGVQIIPLVQTHRSWSLQNDRGFV